MDKRTTAEKYFTLNLLNWYKTHKRKLPWRDTKSPYHIWLSEVILQQTRIDQGLKYYKRFIESYPELKDLAQAKEEEVLKLWQGLGYYSRARNMLYTARLLTEEYHGVFPSDYHALLKLKGIGMHTAAAIASFAYNLPYPVFDGNVFRVIARYHQLEFDPYSAKGRQLFASCVKRLMPEETASEFNQAIMDFGAIQCVPGMPECTICPMHPQCKACQSGMQVKLPVKKKPRQKKTRYLYYFVLHSHGNILIHKRNINDIWKGLYDFPCIESETAISMKNLDSQMFSPKKSKKESRRISLISKPYQQLLTHQKIISRFIEMEISDLSDISAQYEIIDKTKLHTLPLPRLIEKYISDSPLFSL